MATKETLIENASKYVGKVKYVWGGESLDEGGFDCSGYIFNILNDSGIKVGRQTAQGYSKLGVEVSYDKAVPSDLLFFGKSKNNITHIAMYSGDGMMYESVGTSKNTKEKPGKGVVHSKVNRRKDLVLIKRICSNANNKRIKLGGTMYVRNGAGVSYGILTTVHSGDIVNIEKTSPNNWGYIPELRGWISLNTKYTREV